MGVHLSRQLVLEQRETVPDGMGGSSESWSALGTLWAGVEGRSGRVRRVGDTEMASVGFRITVRGAPYGAPSRPVAGQRFREGQRVFRIDAVSEADPQGRYLICFAKEELAA
ncbi:head-tail adaptor protein [Shimia abyssi]|uniref:Head-tail adaptor n=1 Tax=Shimia abyssi TaxID=1662395 RepID=A0A2P8FFT0_9RHOB|nr:head-tail adaptor protein [Shimia abyssi]PSL20576.1 head-tail adaptor [Shimia abyssi]